MAYVLSSVSGNLISAASAGFAPTNSADVSAIASSYQVVSATGTQLYAGTAYVTSVNDNPLSAARAGNAANAVQATSAWYDGTGRLLSSLPDEATVSAIASAYQVVSSVGTSQNGPKSIVTGINGLFISARYADTANEARKDGSGRTISSLPDSAAVSAIASAYAESAASSKQDTLTFGYNTADQISSIDGSALGGMDEAAVSAIASAYAESAASSKQDTLTFGYDAEDKISSIDGSALAGGGGGGGLVTAIGTSESGITSINNSGLVDTAALRSADYSSLYVQEPLYISASGDSSYIGISGDVGGVDSATCSAIASAYAESAVSSVSGNYYTTANESGYALSSDVSGTVDLVSTQSANWGGSALALSAGPGVSLTLSGNTLVASTDETVLWSNDNGAATFTASEVVTNFERIAVYVTDNPLSESIQRVEIPMMGGNLTAPKFSLVSQWDSSWRVLMWWVKLTSSDMKSFSISSAGFAGALANSSWSNGNEPNYFRFYKVVGINRVSGA